MPRNVDLRDASDQIRREGIKVTYYRSAPCSCSGPSDRIMGVCPICFGTGRVYADPRKIRGLLTGVHRQRTLLEIGVLTPGDVILSLDPLAKLRLGVGDKIVPPWGIVMEGDRIKHLGDQDTANYEIVKARDCVYSDLTNIKNPAVIHYEPGVDFQTEGRKINWLAGRPAPPVGRAFGFSYEARPEYIVFMPPDDRFGPGSTDLGQRVMLRLRHVVYPVPMEG